MLLLAHVCVALAAVGHTNDGVFFEWLVPVFFFVVPPHQFASLSDAVDDPATTPQWLEASYSEIVKAVNRHGSVPGALDALSLSAKGKVGARCLDVPTAGSPPCVCSHPALHACITERSLCIDTDLLLYWAKV